MKNKLLILVTILCLVTVCGCSKGSSSNSLKTETKSADEQALIDIEAKLNECINQYFKDNSSISDYDENTSLFCLYNNGSSFDIGNYWNTSSNFTTYANYYFDEHFDSDNISTQSTLDSDMDTILVELTINGISDFSLTSEFIEHLALSADRKALDEVTSMFNTCIATAEFENTNVSNSNDNVLYLFDNYDNLEISSESITPEFKQIILDYFSNLKTQSKILPDYKYIKITFDTSADDYSIICNYTEAIE